MPHQIVEIPLFFSTGIPFLLIRGSAMKMRFLIY